MASGKAGVHVIQLKPIVVQERLQQGCKFVKWDDDSPIGTHVILCIDSKGFFLYWKDSTNEIEYLEISSIRDTRTGRHARVPKEGRLRDSCNIGLPEVPLEDKTFTVVYGPDFVNTSFINFVAPNRDDAIEWTDAVLKMAYNLLALNSSPYTLLAKAHTKIQLMVDREGRVPVKNFIKQYAQHKDDKKRVEKALDSTNIPTETTGKSSSFDPDAFTLETFLQFYKHLIERNEVDEIFDRLTSGGEISKKSENHPRLMTVDQFVDFLNKEQRDPRLNEILYPYADRAKGIELISQYEPSKVNVERDCISADGFLRYLMSDDNAIVAPEKFDHNLDMDQPLNHYFINSSHNTYLAGHQLTGKASVEIYRQCLLAGCRCIELDCWNGRNSSDEPIITHGYTVVSDIPCRDVLEAIAETAFKTSCYPVILSFENHCSTRQQAKIAQYCRKIFGEMLLTEPLSSHPLKPGVNLPSPNLLSRKILIKNKKKHSKQRKNKRGPNPTSTSSTSNVISTSGDVLGTGPSVRIDTASTMTSSGDTLITVASSLSSSGLPSSTPERRATLQTNNSDESNTLEREDSSQIADNDDSIGGQGGSTSTGLAANKTAVSSSCDMDDIESDSSLDDDDAGPPSEAGGIAPGISTGEQLEGEMHKEEEACDDMSVLVNYIQPVNFVSFEHSEKRNRSYEISSFVETHATSLLKERPVDFVNLNKVQLSRIYPKGTRVDSSNYMPQVFWNAGCQMVALNFQTLDLGMQLNLGIFEYNGRSGYLLKPDFMRRMDRKFDPFTESTVDGIIAGYVSVKVISGQFLSDKRTGTYVEVDMFGLPADTIRRKRTKTVPANGVNPIYDDDPFIFKKVVLPDLACLRIAAYEESGKFIGHRILSVVGLRPGYRHLALRNESGQPLTLPTLFVHITVKDYVPEGLFELADALANPIAYQSMSDKRAEQLLALTDDYGDDEHGNSEKETGSRSGLNNASSSAAKVTITNVSSERKANTPDDNRRTSSGIIGSSSKHESMNGTVSATSCRIIPTSSSGTSSSQVSSSPAHPSTVPPLIRQDTTSLRQNQSVRSLSDEAAPERSVYLLESEAGNLEVETLEALKNHKDVLEVNTKLEKDLAETKKKFEKSRAKVASNHQKEHDKLMYSSQSKQRSVLVKNLFHRKSSSSTDAKSLNKRLSEDVTSTSPDTVERLQELHRTWAKTLFELTLEQFNSEKSLRHKYHEKYYAVLEGAMQTSQSNQEKYLQKLHATDVNRVQKRVDAKIKEDYNNYVKKYKDKNELSRVRREQHHRIIDSAVAERQRLDNLLARRKSELVGRHEHVQRELAEDKRKFKDKIELEFQQKCDSLEIEFESTNPTTFIENWTPK